MIRNLQRSHFELPDLQRLPTEFKQLPDAGTKPLRADSRLERVLRSGRFAVTAELNAPDSANPEDVYRNALVLAAVCDGINATDGSGANCHMSSLGCCALLTRAGYEPVFQVGCRDRNRIAIQGCWGRRRWASKMSSVSRATM
jgi:hypothetical protein